MNRRFLSALLFALLAVVAVDGALAAEDPTDASARRPSFFSTDLSGGDLQFLKSATEQGLLQATLGVLAANHASSSEVKDFFGAALAKHHATQNERIKLLAIKKSVTLPTGLNSKQNKIADSLSKLNGLKFDKAYMEEIVTDQQAYIIVFEEGALSRDPEIKAFATTALPALRKNLELVKKMSGIAPDGGAGVHFRVGAPAPSSSPDKS